MAATLMAVVSMLSASAQSAVDGSDKSWELPDYVLMADDTTKVSDMTLSDSAFYSKARGVVFPVNVYKLDMSAPFIVELKRDVLPRARERGLILAGIDIRGAASPEGPYEGNVLLAQRRAQSIIDFLTRELGQSAVEVTHTNSTPEDYARLLTMMREANDPDAVRVEQQMLTYGSDVKSLKVALRKLDGGKLWYRMLATYFPHLRTAMVVVYFRKRKQLQMVEMKPAVQLPAMRVAIDLSDVRVPEEPRVVPEPRVIERRHVLAVSTNLLYDGFYMPNYGWAPSPNVELEYYPVEYGQWTFLAAMTFPYYHRWAKHKFFQLRDYHLEARRYFQRTAQHTGAFAAAYVNNNIYGIGLSKTKGWEGEGLGGAMKMGYVWQLSRSGRWRIEAAAAMGGYVTRFDPYVYGNPITGKEDGKYYYDYLGHVKDFRERNHQRVWIGPTEIGIKIRYDLLYKRVLRPGVSVNRKEVVR